MGHHSLGEKQLEPGHRVVIVGGGFGGLRAAQGLAAVPVQVTLIDRTNHHLFQPLLYQVATAGLSPADIAAPIRSILKHQSNAEVLMAEVTGVDVPSRQVLIGERRVPYDTLVLATGARESYFGHEEWSRDAPGLKSLPDALAIRRRILSAFEEAEMEEDSTRREALLTFILVGAGPTGVEMAGAVAELAHRAVASDFRHLNTRSSHIVLLEAGPRILPTFPKILANRATSALRVMGVDVRVNTPVHEVRKGGVVADGEWIPSECVIWTAGVKASPASRWLDAEADRDGRVRVNADLTVPGHPEIFVIGDTAHVDAGGKPLPGVAPVAMQAGDYVATVITDRLRDRKAHKPFQYLDKGSLAAVGRNYAVVSLGRLHLSGFAAWVLWLCVHIFYLIGFRNRVLVMFQWAWAYLTYQRGARLITPVPEEVGESV